MLPSHFTAATAVALAVFAAPATPEPCSYRDERRTVRISGYEAPYRMFRPGPGCNRGPAAIVVALHGYGGTEDSWFDKFDQLLPTLASQRGFVLVAPAAVPRGRAAGWNENPAWPDMAVRAQQQASERAVLEILDDVRKHVDVDPSRVFLMGHSMGALAAWQFASRFPQKFAAIAAFAGPPLPLEAYGAWDVPVMIVHGTEDKAVDIDEVRAVANALKKRPTRMRYLEVPAGSHTSVVQPNLALAMDFFGLQEKNPKGQ